MLRFEGGRNAAALYLLARQRRDYAGKKSTGSPWYWRIATRPANPISRSTTPATRALDGVYCSSIDDMYRRGQMIPQRPPAKQIPEISNSRARLTFVF